MRDVSVYKDVPRDLRVKSLFILWITGPRSSVRPSLTRAWWLSATGYVAVLEPPPGRGGRQWLGSFPRHSAGVGIPHSHCQVTRSTAILAHSIPSPSSHGSAMARTGRKSLIHTKSKSKPPGQVPVYPLDYRSSFLCPTLVNPGLVAVGHRVCGGPRAAPRERWPPVAWELGASPGIAPGLAYHTATARSPGRQPFWPTQSHLLHPMALQWPERAERALSIPNNNNNDLRVILAVRHPESTINGRTPELACNTFGAVGRTQPLT